MAKRIVDLVITVIFGLIGAWIMTVLGIVKAEAGAYIFTAFFVVIVSYASQKIRTRFFK